MDLIKRYPIILSLIFTVIAVVGIFLLARVSVPAGIVVLVLAVAVLVGRMAVGWMRGAERARQRSNPPS